MNNSHCPHEPTKVIYMGFPMRLCKCGEHHVIGFWSFILEIHFDGVFFKYEGAYLLALWNWLTKPMEEE